VPVIVGVVALGVGIGIGAAVKSSSPKTTAATVVTVTAGPSASGVAPASASSAKAATSTAAAAKAHVGSTIALKSTEEALAVTLVQVKDNPSAKDQFSAPDAGDKFYAAQFRLQNTSTTAYSDSPDNGAVVVDSQGQQFQATFDDTDAGASFPGSTTIPPGQSALGWITFQVPTATVVAAVQFELESGFGSSAQWTVP
jgi:Domain of unknown function (DUF4352)